MERKNDYKNIMWFGLLFIVIPVVYVGSWILYYQFNERWSNVEASMNSMFVYYLFLSIWWFIYSLRRKK